MAKTSPQQTATKAPRQSLLAKSLVTVLAAAVVVALGLGFYFNRQRIFDFIAANSFQASPELAAIDQKMQLTGDGHTIFYATHPSLNSREDFNTHCHSHDDNVSILGCYTGGKIYIYNIEESELNGIKESTAAHELLHAVWERLDSAQKSELASQLVALYNDERYHSLLAGDLESYADENRVDELHSRVGTEIADLPEALERHYAQYFQNQDLIVDFYQSYITPFNELSDELETLSAQLEQLSGTIEQKTQEYHQRAEELSTQIDDFNDCAKNLNCYATETSLYARRSALLAEQTALGALYDDLAQLVDQYNSIVDEYNGNVMRSDELETIINSNKQTESIK